MHRLAPRCLLPLTLLLALAGCSTNGSCGGDEEYLQSVDRPRLRLPDTIRASERIAPLVIPAPAAETVKLDPAPRCIDEPPRYYARKGSVADSAEDAVRVWARAWSDRRVDAVVQAYSAAFQAPEGAGSAAYIDQRREQVANGRAPAAELDELTVTSQGADRRVASFVQRFGDDAVRKELTLVRENGSWRIVAERTLEVL